MERKDSPNPIPRRVGPTKVLTTVTPRPNTWSMSELYRILINLCIPVLHVEFVNRVLPPPRQWSITLRGLRKGRGKRYGKKGVESRSRVYDDFRLKKVSNLKRCPYRGVRVVSIKLKGKKK